jgi:hypothetical protein
VVRKVWSDGSVPNEDEFDGDREPARPLQVRKVMGDGSIRSGRRGDRHAFRGGEPYPGFYRSYRWRRAARACYDRDGWACRIMLRCDGYAAEPGTRHHGLHAAHWPDSAIDVYRAGLDPCDVDALVTACRACHAALDAGR